jgi:hypothetical protein
VRNRAAWFEEHQHLFIVFWWGWHSGRWICLNQQGRLRDDYESQFVSPERAEELIYSVICTRDEIVSNWINKL